MTHPKVALVRGLLLASALFVIGLAPAAAADAAKALADGQNSIDAIEVSTEGGQVTAKLRLHAPLAAVPAAFSLTSPPRVVLDFPNTVNALGKNTQDIAEGDLRSVRLGQSASRTRVVFNLARPAKFTTKLDGSTVLLTLAAAAPGGGPTESTTHFADPTPSQQPHAVRKLDFRRGRNGEGQVVIDLADAGTGIDIKQQGHTIIVDLLQAQLPAALQRRYDVKDFGTPVEQVEAQSLPDKTRVTIQAKGVWEQAAYQTDTRLIVEVKPITEQQKQANRAKTGYTGDKLSLNFQNVEVRAVLQVIADFTSLNIITSDSVSGNLTLRLKDVPWDQALDIILTAKGLDMRKSGNVIWIAPRDELATKEKLALESQQQISEIEPVRTESFQLNYQKAELAQKLISDNAQKILSKRGSAVVDVRTNTLFVQDTPSKLEEIRGLIKQIDVPVRQVLVESRIVEAQDNFAKNLGARLGFTAGGINPAAALGGNVRIMPGGNTQSVGVQTGQTQNYPTSFFPDSYSVNLPAAGLNGANPGQFAITLFNPSLTRFVNLEVSALQADGRGKVISSPRVITANNVEAIIEQGTEIPYQQATSSGATNVSFRKATLSLKVKPQITPDDNVIMKLEVHKDSRGTDTTAGPAIDTKQVNTEVLVENGGTVSIGGIFTQDTATSVTKVPLLGDIPLFGYLFRQESSRNNRTELLIFITPKILREATFTR